MSEKTQTGGSGLTKHLSLVLAEFASPDALVAAAARVRGAGVKCWDVHTPYPVHGLDGAMGLKPTRLGVFSFIAACTGFLGAVTMIQWMNGYDYPLVVGGKQPDAYTAMVPIIFEISVLLTGLTTVFGLFVICGLPRHHHPLFESERFARVTDDAFFISVEPKSEEEKHRVSELLESCGASYIEHVSDHGGAL